MLRILMTTVWSRFWNWGLLEILYLGQNFDADVWMSFWGYIWINLRYDLNAVTLLKALSLWVRCAFGDVSCKFDLNAAIQNMTCKKLSVAAFFPKWHHKDFINGSVSLSDCQYCQHQFKKKSHHESRPPLHFNIYKIWDCVIHTAPLHECGNEVVRSSLRQLMIYMNVEEKCRWSYFSGRSHPQFFTIRRNGAIFRGKSPIFVPSSFSVKNALSLKMNS